MVDTQPIQPPDAVSAVADGAAAAKTLDRAEIKAQIRRGRTRFLAMALAYAMGNFNDNFMKQSVSMLAVSHHLAWLQGWISVFFTLPFLLFAAPAGWMADRFSRRTVVIGAKLLELIFLSLGAWAILSLNWPVIITVIFLMAFQANIFGPALMGSIPAFNYPQVRWRNFVPRGRSGGLPPWMAVRLCLCGMAAWKLGSIVSCADVIWVIDG